MCASGGWFSPVLEMGAETARAPATNAGPQTQDQEGVEGTPIFKQTSTVGGDEKRADTPPPHENAF